MNALTETRAPTSDEPRSVVQWLNALADGSCDPDAFLRGVTELVGEVPDASWEVLSLLDQYYRRGKVKVELYQWLKSRLQAAALGTTNGEDPGTPFAPTVVGEPAPSPTLAQAPPGFGLSLATQRLAVQAVTVQGLATQRLATPRPPAAPDQRSVPDQPAAPDQPAVPDKLAAPNQLAALTEEADLAPPVSPTDPTPRLPSFAENQVREKAVKQRVAVGSLLRGRYRLLRVVGRGSTGTVFEAVDEVRADLPTSTSRIALKVLHAPIVQDSAAYTEARSEFQRMQSLSHPNILRVHEFDRDAGTAFFTMELLLGTSLSRLLRSRNQTAFDRSHALTIIRGVGDALLHAHARGVVNGFISARNVFITDQGEMRVLDFGPSGMVDGKSPVELQDPYSIACLAYLVLTGNPPFPNRSAVETRTVRLNPARPAGLTRREWHALRAGLDPTRQRQPMNTAQWLRQLDPRHEVDPLPVLSELETITPVRRSVAGFYAVAAVVALLAIAGVLAAINPESTRAIAARSMLDLDSAFARASTWLSRMTNSLHGTAADPIDAAAARLEPSTVQTPPPYPASEPLKSTQPPATAQQGIPDQAPPESAGAAAGVGATPPLGPARIEFASDNTEVGSGESAVNVVVRRRGDWHTDASFTWWTEAGTAKAGTDFAAVAPHVEQFDKGKVRLVLSVPIVPNSVRDYPKNFYLVIDRPGPGAILGNKPLAMVSIVPAN